MIGDVGLIAGAPALMAAPAAAMPRSMRAAMGRVAPAARVLDAAVSV